MKSHKEIETAFKERLTTNNVSRISPKALWPVFSETFLQMERECEAPVFDIGIAIELFGVKGEEHKSLIYTLYVALNNSDGEYSGMEEVQIELAVPEQSVTAEQPNWFFEQWKVDGPDSERPAKAILQSAESTTQFELFHTLPACEFQVSGGDV
ncbi:MAG: hypothetical protein AAF699_14330 [Pseudomonadota bacterium]